MNRTVPVHREGRRLRGCLVRTAYDEYRNKEGIEKSAAGAKSCNNQGSPLEAIAGESYIINRQNWGKTSIERSDGSGVLSFQGDTEVVVAGVDPHDSTWFTRHGCECWGGEKRIEEILRGHDLYL